MRTQHITNVKQMKDHQTNNHSNVPSKEKSMTQTIQRKVPRGKVRPATLKMGQIWIGKGARGSRSK